MTEQTNETKKNPTHFCPNTGAHFFEIGTQLANQEILHMQQNCKTSESITLNTNILRVFALTLLANQVFVQGITDENGEATTQWNASRAFVAEKEIEDGLKILINQYRDGFKSGDVILKRVGK